MAFFSRRFLLLFGLLTFLSACAEPLLEADVAQQIVPRTISVDVSKIEGVSGRADEITVAPSKIQSDLTANLERTLARPGRPNADIALSVTKVRLVSPGQAFLLGGTSYIEGILQVTDSRSGAVLLAPTEVFGISEQLRLGGIVGAVTTPAADKDYQQTIRGFSAAIQERLYGDPEGS